MKKEDLLKKIYNRAVEKYEQQRDVTRSLDRRQDQPKPPSCLPKAGEQLVQPSPVIAPQATGQSVTPAGKARVQAITAAMKRQNVSVGNEASGASLISKTEARFSSRKDGAILSSADHKAKLSEREDVMNTLLNVYRDKRQIIEDLPPKHQQLLKKMGKIILGTGGDSRKQH